MTNARDLALPNAKQGMAFVGSLLMFALSLANEYFDLRLVGDYDWEAILIVVLLGSMAMTWSVSSALRR